uniref:Uncharacterized protein n=1 Tax=Erythrolobus madagascarensis TaxID=708628 RepID=A0A7S0T8R7_9RHOD|mmetsp:Transcript_891/g.1712  ORF Transcript_891/g.1712 Transcript_891/m.1712 type:complete len:181 (+) Transcript_891:56-598(+)
MRAMRAGASSGVDGGDAVAFCGAGGGVLLKKVGDGTVCGNMVKRTATTRVGLIRMNKNSRSSSNNDNNNSGNHGSNSGEVRSSRFWTKRDEMMYHAPSCSVDWNAAWAEFAASGMRSDVGRGLSPTPKFLRSIHRAFHNNSSISSDTLSNDSRVWIAVLAACVLLATYVAAHAPLSGSAV